MTVDFHHGSSNFRHKTASMTTFHVVMDWASQITSRDVLMVSSWIVVIHDVSRPSYIGVKPSEPSPKPKICDESDSHGLTCHITCRDDLADDVVIMWQMTWRLCGRWHGDGILRTCHWRGSHVALTWQPRGAHVAATWRWRGCHVAGRWRQPMQFFPDWISAYINPLQPSPHTLLAQPIYISTQQMPNRFKTDINPRNKI
jgi:hypothetical protein